MKSKLIFRKSTGCFLISTLIKVKCLTNMRRILVLFLTFSPLMLNAQISGINHVILIGVDGMGANYISKADSIPVIKKMMREGSYTLHARSVRPSSSAVNWAAMTMGADPSLTGYTKWNSRKPEIPSRVIGQFGMFPSIFSILREQRPESTIGVIYSWKGIGYIFPKKAINKDDYSGDIDSVTVADATHYIKTKKPNLLFIHFHTVDQAGHSTGWGTPAYYHAIQNTGKRIGEIIHAVKDAGIMDQTIILLTADHGGIKKGHGGNTLLEMEIPWIIYGKNIKRGHKLKESVMTYDTAATIAYALGLKLPQVWVGRPVKAVFTK